MPRRVDAWDVWYRDLGYIDGARQKTYACNFCNRRIAYRASRLHRHLGYEGGISDVAYCTRVPLQVRRLFAANQGRIIPSYPEDIPSVPLQEQDSQAEEFQSNNSQTTNTSEAMDTEPALRSPHSASMGLGAVHRTPQDLRQLSMTEGFNASTKLHLDRAWASAFYEANIPFNVIRHPAFIYAVKETAKHRMPAYTPPTYNAVRTSLLQAKKEEVERKTTTQLGDSLHKYGVTLCADGWDNVQNRPLLNIIQTGTRGDLFLGTIDTTGEHKDAQYIAEQISTFVAKVGSHNVVQICTDNAAAMANAGRTVMQSNPHMYVQGCAAHSLDLLLEDWGKQLWIKRLMKKARRICTFVKNHHASQAMIRRFSPNLSIRAPTETRFATNFIMIDRLRLLRNALERMIIDDDWPPFLADLRRRSARAHEVGVHVRATIRSDGFWHSCENFLYMVIPVVKALRVFDGKAPAMGLAWKVMHDLQTHIQSFTEPPFNLEPDLAQQALENFRNRWRLMKTDLHWAGAMLNPMLRGWRSLHDLPESRTILNRVLRRMTPDYDTFLQALAEYQDFLENRGPFEGSTDPRRHDAPLHEWWDAMGSGAKALQTIARRILGQGCSASACERNWSIYSFVHNKVRNRLKHKRADDLVYIYANTRLIRHRRGPRIAQWYGLNQIHSDDDSDGEDPDGEDLDRVLPDDIDDGQGGNEASDDAWDGNDSDGNDSDGDNDSGHDSGHNGGGDATIYDFNEETTERSHAHTSRTNTTRIDAPGSSFAHLNTEEGLGNTQGVPTTANNQMPNVVSPTQPHRDPSIVGPPEQPVNCTDVFTGASTSNNQRTNVVEGTNTSVPTEEPISTVVPPLCSSASIPRSNTGTPSVPECATNAPTVGARLAALRGALGRSGQPSSPEVRGQHSRVMERQASPSLPPRRHSTRLASMSNPASGNQSTIRATLSSQTGGGTRTVVHPIQAHQSTNQANDENIMANECNGRAHGRITRGMKRRRKQARYQGRPLQFQGDVDGRPRLDDHGILDPNGSQRTRRIVIRNDVLHLRSGSPEHDDELSTDDSSDEERDEAPEDPTYRMRT